VTDFLLKFCICPASGSTTRADILEPKLLTGPESKVGVAADPEVIPLLAWRMLPAFSATAIPIETPRSHSLFQVPSSAMFGRKLPSNHSVRIVGNDIRWGDRFITPERDSSSAHRGLKRTVPCCRKTNPACMDHKLWRKDLLNLLNRLLE
jgi:hypothetical protein